MRHLMGLVLAGGLMLGLADESKAQFSLSIGNPYTGQGLAIGNPSYGYGYGTGYGYSGYNPGYLGGYNNVYSSNVIRSNVFGAPGFTTYSSGYGGYRPYPYTGYRNPSPYYGAYGYGNYGNGSRDGFRPFRRFR